jgi:hypothetical protein
MQNSEPAATVRPHGCPFLRTAAQCASTGISKWWLSEGVPVQGSRTYLSARGCPSAAGTNPLFAERLSWQQLGGAGRGHSPCDRSRGRGDGSRRLSGKLRRPCRA